MCLASIWVLIISFISSFNYAACYICLFSFFICSFIIRSYLHTLSFTILISLVLHYLLPMLVSWFWILLALHYFLPPLGVNFTKCLCFCAMILVLVWFFPSFLLLLSLHPIQFFLLLNANSLIWSPSTSLSILCHCTAFHLSVMM